MATRPTLVQRIALEGGEDIEKELKALGKTGEAVFRQLKAAADASQSGFGSRLSNSIAILRTQLAALGNNARNFQQAGRDLGLSLLAVGRNAAVASAAVVGVVGSIAALAKTSIDAAEEVGNQAQRLGLTAEAYQKLEFAAKLGELGTEQFSAGISRLNKILGETGGKGGGDAVKVYEDIGVTVTDANKLTDNLRKAQEGVNEAFEEGDEAIGAAAETMQKLGITTKDNVEALLQLADVFQKMPDGPRKAALAIALFGRRLGPQLIPFLNQGREGIEAFGEEFERLGGGVTTAQTQLAEEANDAIDKMVQAFKSLRTQIGLTFAPAIQAVVEAFTQAIVENRDAIIGFAQGVADQALPVIRDLVAALSGRDGDVENVWILEWRDSIIKFGQDVSLIITALIIPAFNALLAAAQFVANGINGIFGTEVSGGALLFFAVIARFLGLFTLLASSIRFVYAGLILIFGPTGVIAVGARLILTLLLAIFSPAGAVAVAIAGLIAVIVAFWPQVVEAAKAAGVQIAEAFDAVLSAAKAIWEEIKTSFVDAITAMSDFVNGAFEGIWDGLVAGFQAIVDTILGIWNGAIESIRASIDTLIGWINTAIQKIQNLIDLAKQAASAAVSAVGDALGLAGGGQVRGPGTATSDSIPARLSVGEYVVRARAVAHYGPELFAALNRMKLPKDFLGSGFNIGGLVENMGRSMKQGLAIPRFASGGMAELAPQFAGPRGTPVTINMPNGESFDLVAPEEVAGKLAQVGRRLMISTAGRRPGWAT